MLIAVMTSLVALAAPVASATLPEAERLGRALAEQGTLAAMLPLMKASQVAELLAENSSLSATEQAALRETAERTFTAGRERILAATGHAYARELSLADLRALVAFHRTAAARRAQLATPLVIAAAMKAVGPMDFKADTRKAFCAQTGKLCAPK